MQKDGNIIKKEATLEKRCPCFFLMTYFEILIIIETMNLYNTPWNNTPNNNLAYEHLIYAINFFFRWYIGKNPLQSPNKDFFLLFGFPNRKDDDVLCLFADSLLLFSSSLLITFNVGDFLYNG